MGILSKISKAVTAAIPGSAINTALEKRKLERDLRAAGYSRSHATAEASRRFAHEKNHI